jgi:CheY-like chemotaxis protein
MPEKTVRVLLVEAEPDLQDRYLECLAEAGYEVTAVKTPTEALQKLTLNKFQVLVTELSGRNWGMRGLQLIEICRREEQEIKIVLISGEDTIDEIEKSLPAHADAVWRTDSGDLTLLIAAIELVLSS